LGRHDRSLVRVMQQRCLVLTAVGMSSGTIAHRPQVPMSVINTSPGKTVYRRSCSYFSCEINRRSDHSKRLFTALSMPRNGYSHYR